jgi:hypothetical protein
MAAPQRDRNRLRAFADRAITADERVDRRILDGIVDGWLLEQETLRNWRRNPMIYASALTDGVHNLMVLESDPAPVMTDGIAPIWAHRQLLLPGDSSPIVK